MPYPASGDFRILKVWENGFLGVEGHDIDGAFAWGGPAAYQNQETDEVSVCPLSWIDPETDLGLLLQGIYGSDIVRHVDTDTYDTLRSIFGFIGPEPP